MSKVVRHEDKSPPNKQCSILSDRHWGEPSQLTKGPICFSYTVFHDPAGRTCWVVKHSVRETNWSFRWLSKVVWNMQQALRLASFLARWLLQELTMVSMEAILSCRPALSTEWLGWVAMLCELWCIHTSPINRCCRVHVVVKSIPS